jgi:hypothetical protein
VLQAAGAAAQLFPAQLAQVMEQPVSELDSALPQLFVQPGLPLHWATQVVCVVWAVAAQDTAVPVQPASAAQPPSALAEAPAPLLEVLEAEAVPVVVPAPPVA